MARNGSGTYALPATMAPANTVSNSSTVNSIMDDIADALTDSINKDGTKAFAANQSMGGNKLTSVGAGTAVGDAVNAAQLQAGRMNWADGGGTADAITGSYTPAVTAVTDGDLFYVRATAANATTTPTFTPNNGTVTARTIVKNGNAALAAGDIGGDGHELILRYRSSDTKYELLNPKTVATAAYTVNGQTEETSVALADMLGGYDTSGTAERKFSVQNVLKTVNALTEDTSPDEAADFILTYDTSASDVKKVKPSNLASGAWTLVETLTPSSVAQQDTSNLSAYRVLRITVNSLLPASDAPLAIFKSTDGSSYTTWTDGLAMTADTSGAATSETYANTLATGTVNLTTNAQSVESTTAQGGWNGTIMVYNFNQAARCFVSYDGNFATNTGSYFGIRGKLYDNGTTARTHLRFLFDAVNIASGQIVIEGMA